MEEKPRPVGEGVLTMRMWRGIIFVGAVTFTTMMLFQVFNVLNARLDDDHPGPV